MPVFISFEQSRDGEKGSRKPTEFEPTLPTRQSRSSIGSRGRIRDRKHRPFNRYANRQRCLRDMGSSFRQCAQLPQRIAALDDNEIPRLTIHTTPRQPPRLNYPPDDLWRHWLILVIAHRQQRAHRASKTSIAVSFPNYCEGRTNTLFTISPRPAFQSRQYQRLAKATNITFLLSEA